LTRVDRTIAVLKAWTCTCTSSKIISSAFAVVLLLGATHVEKTIETLVHSNDLGFVTSVVQIRLGTRKTYDVLRGDGGMVGLTISCGMIDSVGAICTLVILHADNTSARSPLSTLLLNLRELHTALSVASGILVRFITVSTVVSAEIVIENTVLVRTALYRKTSCILLDRIEPVSILLDSSIRVVDVIPILFAVWSKARVTFRVSGKLVSIPTHANDVLAISVFHQCLMWTPV